MEVWIPMPLKMTKNPNSDKVGSVKKGSLHHRIVVWTLRRPHSFYLILLTFFIAVILTTAAILWKRPTQESEISDTQLSTFIQNNGAWKFVKKYPPDKNVQCVGYEKENGARMTSCYRYNGANWVWVTSY